MTSLRAFHNDPAIQAKYIERVRAHMLADQIVQGYGYWRDGKGCAVGCSIHSNRHEDYPKEIGHPAELAYLEDFLFEIMRPAQAKRWPLRFMTAAKLGADLTRVYDHWCAWMLTDSKYGVLETVSDNYPDIQRIIRETAEDCLAGRRVNAEKELDAAQGARAARAAEAARAAWAAQGARAAEAAEAARAAEAAQGARAAWAAWAAWAARAAQAAWITAAANKLIELMRNA